MAAPDFEPRTAREALLELRRRWATFLKASHPLREDFAHYDRLAEAGLDRHDPINFTLSDQLADRLAEAHKILRPIIDAHETCVEKGRENRSFIGGELPQQIREALSLPPDLEAMVERRIGPR